MVDKNEIEIAGPESDEHILTSLEVSHGSPISQLDHLKLFSADTWEDLTLELVTHWKTHYSRVVLCGAGGDMGRDVMKRSGHPSISKSQLDEDTHYLCSSIIGLAVEY